MKPSVGIYIFLLFFHSDQLRRVYLLSHANNTTLHLHHSHTRKYCAINSTIITILFYHHNWYRNEADFFLGIFVCTSHTFNVHIHVNNVDVCSMDSTIRSDRHTHTLAYAVLSLGQTMRNGMADASTSRGPNTVDTNAKKKAYISNCGLCI